MQNAKISRGHLIKTQHVVVLLPINNSSGILMQLRDINPDISFPGCWGFFGGSIEAGENASQAALRELFEELSIIPETIYALGSEVRINDLADVISTAFTFQLFSPVNSIDLSEGLDLRFLSIEDIELGYAYSKKMDRTFPIVQTSYIRKMMESCIQFWSERGKEDA
jgi:8-oxo-dGTP pyrophosphatase MutT (NUDIX family)